MEISGKTALVTGGGSGLGEATARHLRALGADVALVDLDADKVQATARAIGATAHPADVTSDTQIAEIFNALASEGRTPRIVVNCAGIAPASRVVGRDGPMPLAQFEKVISVNLIGSFNVLRLAAAAMSGLDADDTEDRGVVINTASIAAFEGQIGQTAYAASKGGIVGLTLPAARDLARHRIRVNAIAPGIFLTPMVKGLPEDVQTALAADIPHPARLGDPAEFARTVQYMVETDYLNGETIRLDGATRLTPR